MADTMLAVVKPNAAPGAEIREVKIPGIRVSDVLVKVDVASVCGTDLHIYNWDPWAQGRIHPPLIPGHEFSGAVAGVGNEVTTVNEGDFVRRRCMWLAASAAVPHRASARLPARADRRRGCRRRFRGLRGDSGVEYLEAGSGRFRRNMRRCSTRWAMRYTRCWLEILRRRRWRLRAAGRSGCSRLRWQGMRRDAAFSRSK